MATANKNLSDYDKSLYVDAVNFKIGIAVSDWNFNITPGERSVGVECKFRWSTDL